MSREDDVMSSDLNLQDLIRVVAKLNNDIFQLKQRFAMLEYQHAVAEAQAELDAMVDDYEADFITANGMSRAEFKERLLKRVRN